MTIFRNEHKRHNQKHNPDNYFQQAAGRKALGRVAVVPVDMMTGRIEQAADWPTADSDTPAVRVMAGTLAAAAFACGALGLGVEAPCVSVSPAVISAPDIMPRAKR